MEEIRDIVFSQAIITALAEEMRRDEKVIVYGEDVGGYGGVYGATRGLQKEFGETRVMDTPISEIAITGIAVGAALLGMRPVAEIMYCDFLTQASDQLANGAAKLHYMSGGQLNLPLVIRTPAGGGSGNAGQHSQCLEAWFCHIPGMKVVMPSTPADARGLLKASIRDDNPVLFIEHKKLYRMKGEMPTAEMLIPLGQADIKRPGKDVTLVSWSYTIHHCLEAAEQLAQEGIDVEVLDPRTLQPLDIEAIIKSVEKTGRLVIAHEAVTFGAFGGEIAAQVSEQAFPALKHHVVRVGAKFSPQPFSEPLETFVLPQMADIVTAVKQTLD
jgi:acetoin:2,6-dichlorophenolindophenol oxidoreductase subunit beta